MNKPIFIHIPKTGGTSIMHSMQYREKQHFTVAEQIKRHGESFRELFSFTVVRNPYTRTESMYRYYNAGSKRRLSWHDWLQKNYFDKRQDNEKIMQPQVNWIYLNDLQAVTKIIRFENLEQEYEPIQIRYGARPLTHMNKSVPLLIDWRDYQREAIQEFYNLDFKKLGYEI